MASTTSLLKSAASTRKKVQQQQDAEVAFTWENSAQTYDDYLQYSDYLQKRQDAASDSSEALSYARTARSAQRSYTSNEIQRQQINIMEGRGTTLDKLDTIKSLFYQAQENGDLNLSQNLLSQYDSLSITYQNEQKAAASAFAASSTKEKNALFNALKDGSDDVTLPTGERVTPLAAIAQDLQTTGGSNKTWEAASQTLEAMAQVIIDQYNNATTQDQIDALEKTYGPGLRDLNADLTFKVGGQTLNYQEVVNAAAHEDQNNPLYGFQATYNEATGQTEYKLKPTNVDQIDYIRQINPQTGDEEYVPTQIRTNQNNVLFGSSDQGRSLNTQITNQGEVIGGGTKTGQINAGETTVKRDESQTIGNRLKSLGIIATQNGTTLTIKLPGENVERVATIQPDGSLRYFGQDGQINEIGLVDRNLGTDALPQIVPAGTPRVVSYEELSDFGSQSAFGGTLSQSSDQGTRYISDILGRSQAPASLTSQNIQIGNNFSGYGTAVTSGLLQSAAQTKQAIQKQQDYQDMLQAQQTLIQSTNNFNLNQVPVQQLTSTGVLKKQLQVAAPVAAPRVVVKAPPATPQITHVGVATPSNNIGGVVNATPYRSVTVR